MSLACGRSVSIAYGAMLEAAGLVGFYLGRIGGSVCQVSSFNLVRYCVGDSKDRSLEYSGSRSAMGSDQRIGSAGWSQHGEKLGCRTPNWSWHP